MFKWSACPIVAAGGFKPLDGCLRKHDGWEWGTRRVPLLRRARRESLAGRGFARLPRAAGRVSAGVANCGKVRAEAVEIADGHPTREPL